METNEHDEQIIEILYECQNEHCGQTIRHWK
jgi:hypothetical protein